MPTSGLVYDPTTSGCVAEWAGETKRDASTNPLGLSFDSVGDGYEPIPPLADVTRDKVGGGYDDGGWIQSQVGVA